MHFVAAVVGLVIAPCLGVISPCCGAPCMTLVLYGERCAIDTSALFSHAATSGTADRETENFSVCE